VVLPGCTFCSSRKLETQDNWSCTYSETCCTGWEVSSNWVPETSRSADAGRGVTASTLLELNVEPSGYMQAWPLFLQRRQLGLLSSHFRWRFRHVTLRRGSHAISQMLNNKFGDVVLLEQKEKSLTTTHHPARVRSPRPRDFRFLTRRPTCDESLPISVRSS
jgi:hypothetical protein